eukprot:265086-Chlamydomonas_euryale.AAC.1
MGSAAGETLFRAVCKLASCSTLRPGKQALSALWDSYKGAQRRAPSARKRRLQSGLASKHTLKRRAFDANTGPKTSTQSTQAPPAKWAGFTTQPQRSPGKKNVEHSGMRRQAVHRNAWDPPKHPSAHRSTHPPIHPCTGRNLNFSSWTLTLKHKVAFTPPTLHTHTHAHGRCAM